MIELNGLIQAYISKRSSFFEFERYKWEAVKAFQTNFNRTDIPLEERLKQPFDVAGNLLTSSNYFPAGMLCTFAKEKEKETQECLDNLFDTSLPLADRVWGFINETEKIFRTLQEGGFSDWKGRKNVESYQDTHAISVYLSLRYPQHYCIYRWTILCH